jgi:hypothetical protein
MPPLSSPGIRTVALVLIAAVGCAATPAQVAIPNGGHDPAPLARCRIAADQRDPLVTEWPASSKARLEALMKDTGGIAVAYSGCELQIIDECRVDGTYEWRRTTLATDTTDIHDEDDLYAKMPLGAASLEGELHRAGSLKVVTEVAGQMALVGFSADHVPDTPACAKATHVVRGISVGAFKLLASGQAGAKASVNVGPAGGGGGASESQSVIREAGDPMQCTQATSDAPDAACRSPIQIFLDRIQHPNPSAAPTPASTDTVAMFRPAPDQAFSPQPAPVPESTEPSSGPSRLPGWILSGAGLVSAGIGTYLFTQASSAKSSIQNGGLATGDDIQSAASRAATDSDLGFVLVGVGVALVITALPFFLASGNSTQVASGAR